MRIVIISASKIETRSVQKAVDNITHKSLSVEVLCTGVSVPFTIYNFQKYLFNNSPADLYINAGICGSFRTDWQLGSVLEICEDRFADIEIRSENEEKDMFDTGFWQADEKPFSGGWLVNKNILAGNLPKVRGITVNATSGESHSIAERVRRFNPDTESMEGAAFAYVCENENLTYRQIRAVSNTINRRSKQIWDIDLALNNLNRALKQIITERLF